MPVRLVCLACVDGCNNSIDSVAWHYTGRDCPGSLDFGVKTSTRVLAPLSGSTSSFLILETVPFSIARSQEICLILFLSCDYHSSWALSRHTGTVVSRR